VLLAFKQFVCNKKSACLIKNKLIKNTFEGPKSLKIKEIKTHFWQILKNKAFAQKLFLT
jgi:hypothetical protein